MYDNDQYLATLALFLTQTLDPNKRQHGKDFAILIYYCAIKRIAVYFLYFNFACTAEKELFKAEAEQKDFPIAVMQLVTRENTEQSVRFSASLFFKNYIRRN